MKTSYPLCGKLLLFLPDFNRRYRNCTDSADRDGCFKPVPRSWTVTTGGEFHPALRLGGDFNAF